MRLAIRSFYIRESTSGVSVTGDKYAVSPGRKVGPLFTDITSPTVRPQDAIVTPKPQVGSLVRIASRSDSRTSIY